jgi:hypothetical protein
LGDKKNQNQAASYLKNLLTFPKFFYTLCSQIHDIFRITFLLVPTFFKNLILFFSSLFQFISALSKTFFIFLLAAQIIQVQNQGFIIKVLFF